MTSASESRLTLTHLESQYELACPPEQLGTLQRELDGIAREQLPRVLAEQLLPQIDSRYSVYRIRHIDIDLAVARECLKSGLLPRLWARSILLQVFEQLRYGDHGNVARFADHAEFTAAYINDRLLGGTSESWAFEDFAPLRLLNSAEAITQVLVARPGYFRTIAGYLRRRDATQRLARVLDAAQVTRVLSALQRESVPVAAADLLQFAQSIGVLDELLSGDPATAQRRRLLLLLRTVGDSPASAASLDALLQMSQHALELYDALRRTRSDERRRAAPPWQRQGRNPHTAQPVLPPDVRQWWSRFRGETAGDDYLQWLLDQVESARVQAESPPVPGVPGAERAVATAAVTRDPGAAEYASPLAGLGLLLTSVSELKLATRLGVRLLPECLGRLLDEGQRRLWKSDPLAGAWFPSEGLEPLPSQWPAPPETLLQGLDPRQRRAVEAARDADAWAVLLAACFARRIPGLEASSVDYLRKQFFVRPGKVTIDAKTVNLRLESLPLGIVLKMAGLVGWQGRLAWLGDRELTIELPL